MTVVSPDHGIDSIERNPEYGYNGRILDIRREEYSHLGGILQQLNFALMFEIQFT